MKIKTYPEATQELRKIAAFCKQQWGIEEIGRASCRERV